jgi:hypothetical protein
MLSHRHHPNPSSEEEGLNPLKQFSLLARSITISRSQRHLCGTSEPNRHPSCQRRLASNPVDAGKPKFGLGRSALESFGEAFVACALRWGDDQQYRISPRLLAILTALFAKRSAAFQNWLDWPVSCRLPFCKTPDWQEYCDQENMLLVYHQKLPAEHPHPTLPNR